MPDLRPRLFASDLEGVLVPEIWIAFAEKTGIEQLRLTTRDISDYDQLMQMRLKILKERNLRLQDIEEVIATIAPLPGAGNSSTGFAPARSSSFFPTPSTSLPNP